MMRNHSNKSIWDNIPLFPSISDAVMIIQRATDGALHVDRYKLNEFFTFYFSIARVGAYLTAVPIRSSTGSTVPGLNLVTQ